MTLTRTRRTGAVKAAGRWLVHLLLVAVTLAAAGYLLPSVLGYDRYVITGGSMAGTIEKGSIAFARPVPVAELAPGDIVTYLPPPDSGVPNLVTHRIISRGTGENGTPMFQTQGDANPAPDPWKFSLTSDTQNVVEFSVPLAGYAVIALADRETRMAVVGIPAGLIALGSMLQLLRSLRDTLRSHRRDARHPSGPRTSVPAGA